VTVGCCAFEHHVDFRDDPDKQNPRRGSLYIPTTGILPRFRGNGFGDLLKCWQIAYARRHGFTRIVTNCRKCNRPMIELNKKFGFKIIRRPKAMYYEDPPEPTIVMELRLR
jgi:ribosomal protein S18 acetylase RimI-like enzyme